jgi:hypothetical protein
MTVARRPESSWEFRYLAIVAEFDLARQSVPDDFDGWEFVSFCYQSHDKQWYCVFKRPTLATVRTLAA